MLMAVAVAVTSTMTILPLPLASASAVRRDSGSIHITNSCPYTLYIYERTDGACQDQGINGKCVTDGGEPYTLGQPTPAIVNQYGTITTESSLQTLTVPLIVSTNWENTPHAIKIFRNADRTDPTAHLELSYGLSEGGRFRWAFTSIGAAFKDENVKVEPSGATAG
ncbi:hypothetical protein DL98DRAFT_650596 [Cadophora sp. DSE1049]|nr:hypothetical protein DL98DRAFT_650596 [Cadophora sp. DSE1049]